MLTAKPRAVLWDLDGTLIDSERYHWRSWRETMEREGRPISYEEFRASFGQRNDSILRAWLGNEATLDRLERIGDTKEARYRDLIRTEGIEPLPGAREWIKQLHRAGWRQAVASSAPRLNVEAVLNLLGLASCFNAIVSAEDVQHGKPDPEVFLVAASRLQAEPKRSVVVEDALAGIEAARRAGMSSIAVGPKSAEFGADVAVRTLAELKPDTFDVLVVP